MPTPAPGEPGTPRAAEERPRESFATVRAVPFSPPRSAPTAGARGPGPAGGRGEPSAPTPPGITHVPPRLRATPVGSEVGGRVGGARRERGAGELLSKPARGRNVCKTQLHAPKTNHRQTERRARSQRDRAAAPELRDRRSARGSALPEVRPGAEERRSEINNAAFLTRGQNKHRRHSPEEGRCGWRLQQPGPENRL